MLVIFKRRVQVLLPKPVREERGEKKVRKGEEGREREKKEGKNKERSCVTALLSYPCPPC
jgi:hypothetical protein